MNPTDLMSKRPSHATKDSNDDCKYTRGELSRLNKVSLSSELKVDFGLVWVLTDMGVIRVYHPQYNVGGEEEE